MHEYLYKNKAALTFEQMVQFLRDVQSLQQAQEWTRVVDGTYQKLFGVPLSRTVGYKGVKLAAQGKGKNGGKGSSRSVEGRPGLRSWDMGEGRAIRLAWGLACAIPPNAAALVAEPPLK
ncbi:hypothetical protein ABPG75_006159 [Micractinium tetrahymenae]